MPLRRTSSRRRGSTALRLVGLALAVALPGCATEVTGDAPPAPSASPSAPSTATPPEATSSTSTAPDDQADAFVQSTTVDGVAIDLLGPAGEVAGQQVVVMLHGAAYNRGSMRDFATVVANAGFAVAVPDWGAAGSGGLCAAAAGARAAMDAGTTSSTILFGMSVGASALARDVLLEGATSDDCELPDWELHGLVLDGGSYGTVIEGLDAAPSLTVLPVAGGNEANDIENAEALADALSDLGSPTTTLMLEGADHCHPACRDGAPTWPLLADAMVNMVTS